MQICCVVFLCFLFQKTQAGHIAGDLPHYKVPEHSLQDTIPAAFVMKWVVNIGSKKHTLKFEYRKNPDDSSLLVSALNKDPLFPESFYKTLEAYFELTPVLSSGAVYAEVYERSRGSNFTDNSQISYTKELYGRMTAKAIYIYDIDPDGVPEVLLADLEGSSADNNIYVLYRMNKRTNRFEKADHFFNGAFYGWDKTRRYIITGKSDTQERHLVKNKIVSRALVPVKKCTASANRGNSCF